MQNCKKVAHLYSVSASNWKMEDGPPKSLTKEQLEAKIREIENEIKIKDLELRDILNRGVQAIYDRLRELRYPNRETEKALW